MADIKTTANHQLSNTTLSAQDTGDTSEPASEAMTKYNMYYTASRLNLTLHDGPPSTPAIYYMESDCSLSKLLLLLRRGDAKTSPMVAFAKLPLTSRHMQIGKGDCGKDAGDQIVWEELHREKNLLFRSDYHFGTSEGDESGKRAEFDWRKNQKKLGKTVYDCLDRGGRTVAKMFSGGGLNWKKGGEVEVLEELDEGLKEVLIVSALAIWAMEGLNYKSLFQGFSSEDKKD
ncbi:hypothetical protein OEA41_006747 [Lepraria neglecta]|uniref:Uncharacterized protein n=1 Tax=Lepraria neglecta TaxID=209136 RepID=A0AAD9Z9G0_9LECA|nr:hypothetical protein OEA41_006747 [Lepraria neglecta]